MNAKDEFIVFTRAYKVICALLYTEEYTHDGIESTEYILKEGYTPEDLEVFLKSINFNYNSGYGMQHLFGTIWCQDGIWMERGEYDGSEWWDVHQYPTINTKCKS